MKTRIIVAAIGIPLLLAVIFLAPLWATGLVVGAIAAGAAWEFLSCTAAGIKTRLKSLAAITAASIPVAESLGMGEGFTLFVVFALFTASFCEVMASYRGEKRMSYNAVALAMVAGIVLPMLLAALVRLGENGRGAVYVFLPFVVTFSCDSGAYFVGVSMGKHKLAPNLSPNKTIEGSVGGMLAAVIVMLAYGYVLSRYGYTINYLMLGAYGFVGSLICQIGDLSFSAVKRETGIKDYGKIIPGHGGMLDRFDSMVLTAPAVELLVMLLPAISL